MNCPGSISRLPPLPATLTVLSLLPLTACAGTDASSDWTGTATDSAGVQVVANPTDGTWTADDAWTVEEVFSVGTLDAEEAYQFGQISGVDVDADGNVYVADVQAQNVRVFDASGTYLRTIGQPGSGPGEFGRNLAGVFVVDGGVLVPDLSNQRLSRFGLDGTFISSERVDMGRGIPIRWDVTSRGRLVAQRRLVVPGDSVASVGDAIVTLAAEGETVDTVATLGMGQSVQITGGIPKIRQFEPDPVWDAAPDGRLVTAMNSAWRFEVYGADRTLERVVSRPFERKPVTERDKQAVRGGLREMYRTQGVPPQAYEALISAMEFADYFPAFASVAFGPAGSLWVQNLLSDDELSAQGATVAVLDMGSTEWGVFDADGRYLGTVAFPGTFQPVRVIGDRFFGIARDDFDVQSLKVYRVVMN